MYARVTRVKSDPARIDAIVEELKTRLVPIFKQQPGYLGVISVADRQTGEGATTTYWDSLENLKASEGAIFAARDQLVSDEQAELLSFHRCEIVSRHVNGPAQAGSHTRAATLQGVNASNRAALIERHQTVIAPFILQQPGARASLLLIDDENGLALAVSSYDTAANRDAAAKAIDEKLRADPGALDLQRTTTMGEVTHADLAMPVSS